MMSFTHHDKYVQLLFAHLNRDPPSGYNRCSISQLLAADRAAWCHLIEKNVKPRPDANGVLALDTKLEEALKSYEVSFTLLPMPSKQTPKAAPTQPAAAGVKPQNSVGGKGKNKGYNRFRPYGSKGKGKSKSKSDQRIPREIREAGGTATTLMVIPSVLTIALRNAKNQSAKVAVAKVTTCVASATALTA